jgi:hypothetical protein
VNADSSDGPPRTWEPETMPPRGRLARHVWWMFLGTGFCGVILGVWTLVTTPSSSATVANIAGIALIFDALLLCLLASQADEWSGFYLLGALTAVAGIALLGFSQSHDLFRLEIVLGAVLTLRGLIDALVAWGGIIDFTDGARAWEWTLLAVGAVIFLLGLGAFLARGGSTFELSLIVGSSILARGIGMLAISYRLHALT